MRSSVGYFWILALASTSVPAAEVGGACAKELLQSTVLPEEPGEEGTSPPTASPEE